MLCPGSSIQPDEHGRLVITGESPAHGWVLCTDCGAWQHMRLGRVARHDADNEHCPWSGGAVEAARAVEYERERTRVWCDECMRWVDTLRGEVLPHDQQPERQPQPRVDAGVVVVRRTNRRRHPWRPR